MTRLDKINAPLVIALGHSMRQGKSEAANAIDAQFHKTGAYKIMRSGFAAALRTELEHAVETIEGEDLKTSDKVKELCLLCSADYDTDAPVTPDYPYGKQRALLQWWGQWRREQDPFYWINALEQSIIERQPQIVLIDDLRYPNEFFWVQNLGGFTVKMQREGYQAPPGTAKHISETALDGYEFDYTITSEEGQVERLRSDAIELFDMLVKRWSGAECAATFETFGELFAVQESNHATAAN